MATRTKPAAGNLYEGDFYVRAGRHIEPLRARRFDELALENLIEEVEDSGGALKSSGLVDRRHADPGAAPLLDAAGRAALEAALAEPPPDDTRRPCGSGTDT